MLSNCEHVKNKPHYTTHLLFLTIFLYNLTLKAAVVMENAS